MDDDFDADDRAGTDTVTRLLLAWRADVNRDPVPHMPDLDRAAARFVLDSVPDQRCP
jgi:hypothetical protein